MVPYPLLESIDDPAALRRLDRDRLPELAGELRAFLLSSVACTGGHLSSNLGTVELAIALHYVYDTPRDRIVWDVGHQTYAHKVLTGRRAQMARLRMAGGPSGFPRRSESEYDTFGTAHSSTSISAALGMAIAAQRRGEDRRVVAVIGDGAMSAGMAFEALNNAGTAHADLLVVLNDNEMSISEPVGALNGYLASLLSSRFYNTMRRGSKEMLSKVPPVKELAKRWEEHMKGMVLPGTLFEEFGFNYIGPIDGHDVDVLVRTLANVRALQRPAAPARDHAQGLRLRAGRGRPDPLPRRDAVRPGRGHRRQGARQARVHAGLRRLARATWRRATSASSRITPAMREGSGLVRFSQAFPDRYFDVGIAEQHAVTFAAGLACDGHEAGGRDLLDVPPARLRPADPRRRAAEPARRVRDRPRGHRRRRRRDAHRRLRPVVPALHPEHDGHGARRRERVPADAVHGVHARHARRGPLSARRRSRRRGRGGDDGASGRQGRAPAHVGAAHRAHRDPRVRRVAAARARGGGGARRHGRQHALRQAARRRARHGARPRPRRARHRRGERGDGRRGKRGRPKRSRPTASTCPFCTSGCPTRSSTTAIPRSSSPTAASTARASRRRSKPVSARRGRRLSGSPPPERRAAARFAHSSTIPPHEPARAPPGHVPDGRCAGRDRRAQLAIDQVGIRGLATRSRSPTRTASRSRRSPWPTSTSRCRRTARARTCRASSRCSNR